MAATFCGLICCPKPTERVPVPLKSVSVHAEVRGWTVGVTAELAYENKLPEAIECQFVFPLADTSAVYRLEADIAGKKLVADCRPRKEAEETYRDAVDSGQAGVLLENQLDSPDVFRIMLGNLPPGKEAKVLIAYVQPAERDVDGSLTITLPAVLNPRYVPHHQIADAEKMKEQFHSKVPYVAVSEVAYTMSFSAKIDLGINAAISEVKAVNEKDSVKVDFQNEKQLASVTLNGNFVQDHDFGLIIVPAEPFKPMVYLEPGQAVEGGEKKWTSYDMAAAWFEPESSKDKTVGAGVAGDEYWLVIDRSGSMDGSKINDAKTALVLFVKSLPVGCKFNIVGFGSTFIALFPDGSVEYSEEAIEKAVQHSNELEADLGGTEILEPLKYIYDKPKPTTPGARQFIVVLTDGEVGNTQEVIDLAQKNASTSRVFAVGIGEGASTALVNGISRVSGGVAEYVKSSSDRLQAKVISLLKAATNPAAEHIKVSWEINGGKVISLLPEHIPTAAYSGRPIKQYALIERHQGNNADGFAKLTAVIGGKPVEHKLSFNIASSVHSPSGDVMPLHRLAAKSRIQEMNDQQYQQSDFEGWKKQIVAISVATGVLCNDTAFVAVDPVTKDEVKDAKGRPRFVDVERPTSYGHFGGGGMPMMMMACMAAPPMARMARSLKSFAPVPAPTNALFDAGMAMECAAPIGNSSRVELMEDVCDEAEDDVCDSPKSYPPPPPPPAQPEIPPMDKLIRLQKFNGSWTISNDLASIITPKKTPDQVEMRREATAAIHGKVADENAIATLIAVALLRKKFSASRDEWELIEQKALNFLNSALGLEAKNIDQFVDLIAKAFSF